MLKFETQLNLMEFVKLAAETPWGTDEAAGCDVLMGIAAKGILAQVKEEMSASFGAQGVDMEKWLGFDTDVAAADYVMSVLGQCDGSECDDECGDDQRNCKVTRG